MPDEAGLWRVLYDDPDMPSPFAAFVDAPSRDAAMYELMARVCDIVAEQVSAMVGTAAFEALMQAPATCKRWCIAVPETRVRYVGVLRARDAG